MKSNSLLVEDHRGHGDDEAEHELLVGMVEEYQRARHGEAAKHVHDAEHPVLGVVVRE